MSFVFSFPFIHSFLPSFFRFFFFSDSFSLSFFSSTFLLEKSTFDIGNLNCEGGNHLTVCVCVCVYACMRVFV